MVFVRPVIKIVSIHHPKRIVYVVLDFSALQVNAQFVIQEQNIQEQIAFVTLVILEIAINAKNVIPLVVHAQVLMQINVHIVLMFP
jgi:hypothetical protein